MRSAKGVVGVPVAVALQNPAGTTHIAKDRVVAGIFPLVRWIERFVDIAPPGRGWWIAGEQHAPAAAGLIKADKRTGLVVWSGTLIPRASPNGVHPKSTQGHILVEPSAAAGSQRIAEHEVDATSYRHPPLAPGSIVSANEVVAIKLNLATSPWPPV